MPRRQGELLATPITVGAVVVDVALNMGGSDQPEPEATERSRSTTSTSLLAPSDNREG